MTQYKIARVTKQQKQIIREITYMGLNRFYYNEFDEIQEMASRFGLTNADIIACIQYVEVKVLGKFHYTSAENFDVKEVVA